MDLARYVVEAVVLEGRSYREVARAHGVSKSWVGKLLQRFRDGGYAAIEPRSKAPKHIPHRTCSELEDEIVALRKELSDQGLDAGAQTIHYHLSVRRDAVPSVSTIWRVLRRRGFVTPQPHKRPRSSFIRFEAQLPNECWQSDATHWSLAGGTERARRRVARHDRSARDRNVVQERPDDGFGVQTRRLAVAAAVPGNHAMGQRGHGQPLDVPT